MVDPIRRHGGPAPAPATHRGAPAAPTVPPAAPQATAPARPAAGATPTLGAHPNADSTAARRAAEQGWYAHGDVNEHHDQRLSDETRDVHDSHADHLAVLQVHANAELEQTELAHLTPDQQASYQHLATTVENNPQAHLALQLLLVEHHLVDDRHSHIDDRNLLQQLDGLSHASLTPPLRNDRLLGEVLRETAQPASINQQFRDTCTAGALQIMTARDNPAEYVRIVGGLAASGTGSVELADHSHLTRVSGSETPTHGAADGNQRDRRTDSSRLWQSALMGLGAQIEHGTFSRYDVATDHVIGMDGDHGTGLMDAGTVSTVAAALTGDASWQTRGVMGVRADLTNHVENAVQTPDGNLLPSVAVTMRGGDFTADGNAGPRVQAHVTGFDRAADRVDVSYGPGVSGPTQMTVAQFQQRILGVDGYRSPHDPTPSAASGPHHAATPTDVDRVSDELMNQLRQHLASGAGPMQQGNVPVALRWGEIHASGDTTWGHESNENHEVLVTGIHDHRVYFMNSQGSVDSLFETDFRNRLVAIPTHGS